MTPWTWHVGHRDSVEWDGVYNIDQCATRAEAITVGLSETRPGETFYIIEARSSSTAKHEFSEVIPFLRARNKEAITNGLQEAKGVAA